MKVKYYTDGDILVIKLSNTPYDYAEQEGDFIVHFSKDKKPTRIEVLNASRFIKQTSDSLPSSLRRTMAAV